MGVSKRIYPVETNRNNQYSGQLIFDDLTVEVPPAIEMPEEETTSKDPIIIGNDTIGKDRWKFAVLSDSQFVAASPDSIVSKPKWHVNHFVKLLRHNLSF